MKSVSTTFLCALFAAATVLSTVQAQTGDQDQQPLSDDEQKIVAYIMKQVSESKAGKPNFGPETAMAVYKELGIQVTPNMVPRIRAAVVTELKAIEARLMLKEGSAAPDFNLPVLGGGEASLSALKGKVVVVNFWATWCPPCLVEMPVLNELYETYRDRGVEVLGLSLDEEGLPVTKPFVERLNVSYPIVEADRKTYQAYGNVLTIPHTFVINREGTVTKRFVNNQTKDEFKAAIKAALAGK
ncbi:MAG: TlpA disulfide reductase family protein [Gemmatimonadetes bacterium]|nr:TlpA disulfide reductase family protein [Gemmatimonadota bacterium]